MSPLDEKEAKARVVYVLHEMGYNYFNIPKLTLIEIKDLFSGGRQVESERATRMKQKLRVGSYGSKFR